MNPEVILYLIKRLQRDNSLDDINKYEMVELRSANGDQTVIYLKDGKPVFDLREYGSKIISKEDEVDYQNLFHFTMEFGVDISNAVQDFIKLRSKLERKDPNVTFTILGSSFIVNSKGKTSCYSIKTGEIIPMEETGRHKVDFFTDKPVEVEQQVIANKPEKNTQLAKPKRETFIQRMFNSIQRMLFPKATEGVSDIKKAKKGQPTGGSYLSSLRVEASEIEQGFQNDRDGGNSPSKDGINQSNSDDRYI